MGASRGKAEVPKERLAGKQIPKLDPTMEEEFTSIREDLWWFEERIVDQICVFYRHRQTIYRAEDIDRNRKLLRNLRRLQKIHTLMPTSAKDRLFRLIHKGLVLEPPELAERTIPRKPIDPTGEGPSPLAGGEETFSEVSNVINPLAEKSAAGGLSPIALQPGKLRGDALDDVMDRVTWEWLARLNALLPEIMTSETAIEIEALEGVHLAPKIHLFDALLLQRYVFRTAEFIDRHRLVPPRHLESFLQLKDTVRFASINVHEGRKILSVDDYWYRSGFDRFSYSKKFVDLVDKVARNLKQGTNRVDPHRVMALTNL
ncbi:hypothetical protein MJO28_008503 [Puccinia striiformis f. sp. tritici]|uniref:Uncharacterized protein n=4 Tax=Puccinia striiformis TaxID=27350 RepID=A0A0L0VGA2_9BASI|nr:hypothetical protein MJO28_008503 [Puccinia striiformis f. sp. tritici]KNE98236.1 hypothetical protein PSTG_08506 [Puccinia striiformis f. sp. tritici PST-78]POW04543.1 hypothetical protein PSTT_10322 [Puccinia striiformis]POW19358.1 hypothetical protein PSHT_04741 [Puccinia striiformis]